MRNKAKHQTKVHTKREDNSQHYLQIKSNLGVEEAWLS